MAQCSLNLVRGSLLQRLSACNGSTSSPPAVLQNFFGPIDPEVQLINGRFHRDCWQSAGLAVDRPDNAGSSDQCVLRLVCANDFEGQEVKISTAISASLPELDLVVCYIEGPSRNRAVVPGEYAVAICSQCRGELHEDSDSRAFRWCTSPFKESFRLGLAAALPQLLQIFLHAMVLDDLQVLVTTGLLNDSENAAAFLAGHHELKPTEVECLEKYGKFKSEPGLCTQSVALQI